MAATRPKPKGRAGENQAKGGRRSQEEELFEELAKGRKADVTKITRLLDGEQLESLLETRNARGVTALNMAILHRSTAVAQLLLDRGANPLLRDAQGQTALHAAAQVDDCKLLVDMMQGCDVNVQDDSGQTPLHIAVRNTSVDSCQWLIFGGANPTIQTKIGQTCRQMTDLNIIHQTLREFSPDHSPATFATLEPGCPFTADDLHFSLQLLPPTDKKGACFAYRSLSETAARSLATEDEEIWGTVTEYRVLDKLRAHLVFPLHDVLDAFYELVLRTVKSGGGSRDQPLEMKDVVAATSSREEQDPDAKDQVSGTDPDDLTLVEAHGDVDLDLAANLLLVYRPFQQQVELGRGCRKIKSSAKADVELVLDEKFSGNAKGNLQVEPSLPMKEKPALMKQMSEEETDVQSQTDFFKLRMKTEDASQDVASCLHLTMPVPSEYSGGDLRVLSRMSSVDSASEADSDADDLEREAKRWCVRDHVAKLPKNAKSLRMPVHINQTMTALEVKSAKVPEERLCRQAAKQYKKRKNKPVVFFVASRPWPGWRECQELLVVVTSPTHLSSQLRKHLVEGFCALQLSGELLVPKIATFRVSVVGNVLIQCGKEEEELSYRFGTKWPTVSLTDYCKFVLRGREEVQVREGGFIIFMKRSGRTTKGTNTWQEKGTLRFKFDEDKLPVPGPENEMAPFTDVLLLDIAHRTMPSEAPQLAIRMGLSRVEVEAVMVDKQIMSASYKTFEMLAKARRKFPTALDFAKCLVSALDSMEWTDIVEWLLNVEEIKRWTGFSELRTTLQR